MIVGGYGQFAKGLASNPTVLDIRYNQCVDKISYSQIQNRRTPELDEPPVTITCSNAQTFQADAVVFTASLGVLKSSNVTFEPELPEQKRSAISRLGFGLLNKVTIARSLLTLGCFSI
jgi:monoamine oxidase